MPKEYRFISVRTDPETKDRIAQLAGYVGSESGFIRFAIGLADALMTAAELRVAGADEDALALYLDYEMQRQIAVIANGVTKHNEHDPGGNRGRAKTPSPWSGRKEPAEAN
jgi:hypothetical protein